METFLIRDVECIILAVYVFTHPAICTDKAALIQSFVKAEICDIYRLCIRFYTVRCRGSFLRIFHVFQH